MSESTPPTGGYVPPGNPYLVGERPGVTIMPPPSDDTESDDWYNKPPLNEVVVGLEIHGRNLHVRKMSFVEGEPVYTNRCVHIPVGTGVDEQWAALREAIHGEPKKYVNPFMNLVIT